MFNAILKCRLRRYCTLSLLCLAHMALCTYSPHAAAQVSPSTNGDANEPALIQADRMAYNEKSGIIAAIGHVEVAQGDQVLHADKIVYYLKTNVVKAEGNVALLQPSGEVIFAHETELTDDMKEGFVEKVRVLFPDGSRLAARDARRYEGRYLIADRGIYTACKLCVENPEEPPLWQMKAARITHDNVEHEVIYRDASLEFGGIPVMFTPYFAHPDFTVKRRQGLLTPSGGYNQYVGTFVRVPYYVDIAPNSDAVITPIFSSNDHLQLTTQWRHRFVNGSMQWDGSFTHTNLIDEYGVDQGNQWRGNLFGTTLFDLSNVWRAGTDVAFASDKSYLQRYNITSEDLLVNRGYIEGFNGRDYVEGNLYYFQDLRPGPQQAEPFVTPDIHLSALGEPNQTLGGRWSLDAGLLVTSRDESMDVTKQGPNTRRLSLNAGWERQFASSTGFLTNVSGFTRLDSYWADNVPFPEQPLGTGFSNITDVRPFAQADITVSYPLGRHGDSYQQILEPIVMLSAAPRINSQKLPNEDSLDGEFDTTNLFASNRFTGIDRLEDGIRTAYGLRHSLYGDNGARIVMVGGQIFRLKKDTTFPPGSGLRDRFSDYVGRLEISPASWLSMSYGFRLDKSNLTFQRQEAQASAGIKAFRPFITYLTDNRTEVTTDLSSHIEEATFGFTSTFAKYYTVTARHTQAFLPQPGPRYTEGGIAYQDECFMVGITVRRDETNRADVRSGTSAMFHFYLKNIGGIHTDSVSSGSFQTPSLPSIPLTPEQDPALP